MWVLPFQLSSNFASGWYNMWKKYECMFVCSLVLFFNSSPEEFRILEVQGTLKICHNDKNWRLWKAVEAKKQHCLEWKSFIWWVRLHAGVGLEPSGNLMIYSLSASADRQEVNGLYVSACFNVGWLFIRQTAPVKSQYKPRFGSLFSSC